MPYASIVSDDFRYSLQFIYTVPFSEDPSCHAVSKHFLLRNNGSNLTQRGWRMQHSNNPKTNNGNTDKGQICPRVALGWRPCSMLKLVQMTKSLWMAWPSKSWYWLVKNWHARLLGYRGRQSCPDRLSEVSSIWRAVAILVTDSFLELYPQITVPSFFKQWSNRFACFCNEKTMILKRLRCSKQPSDEIART